MPSSTSSLARALEPVAAALWLFFVIVSCVVGVIWACGIGDAQLADWVSNRDLLLSLQWLLRQLDFVWIILAAANAYAGLVQREGQGMARRWILIILLSVTVLAWLSARIGFPLGRIQYGLPLGPIQVGRLYLARLGPVPLGLPLFWFAVIIGVRDGLLRLFPRWSHAQVALGVGAIGLLTDASLEPLAAKLRGFWFWRSGSPAAPPIFEAPFTGYLAWALLAGLLAYGLRQRKMVRAGYRPSWQPGMIVVIFHVIFLAAHVGRWVRG